MAAGGSRKTPSHTSRFRTTRRAIDLGPQKIPSIFGYLPYLPIHNVVKVKVKVGFLHSCSRKMKNTGCIYYLYRKER
jgi:hypothetical protein